MLTPAQRAQILAVVVDAEANPAKLTDEDIWYGFLSALFGAGKTLKDLKLNPGQQAEIMACLRRAPSVAPRTFSRRGERPARSSSATDKRADNRTP